MNTHDIIGRDTDEAFAVSDLSDYCIEAANRTAKLFDPHYPGWQLYSRIVRGDTVFDRQLASWAIGMARRYARTRQVSGWSVVRPSIRDNDWIAQAGMDALEKTVFGKFSASAKANADSFGIDNELYKWFRDDIATLMAGGFAAYQLELQIQYAKVLRENADFFLGDAA
jgi:hypothetical protein